jgi:hypothetical protein
MLKSFDSIAEFFHVAHCPRASVHNQQSLAGFAAEERERFSSGGGASAQIKQLSANIFVCPKNRLVRRARVDIHSGMTQNIIQTSVILGGGRQGGRGHRGRMALSLGEVHFADTGNPVGKRFCPRVLSAAGAEAPYCVHCQVYYHG